MESKVLVSQKEQEVLQNIKDVLELHSKGIETAYASNYDMSVMFMEFVSSDAFSRLSKEQKQNAFNQFEDLRIVLATLINVHWTLKKEKELEEVSSFNN